MMSLSANLKQKQLLCGFIPSKSFLQVSLCHIVYHYPRALPLLCPPGRGVNWGSGDMDTYPHRTDATQALCCLEGSTLSNLVHRRRRCARIGPIWYCCLEGSTPEDGEVSLLRRGRWRDSFPSLVTTLHTPGGRTLPYGALSGS